MKVDTAWVKQQYGYCRDLAEIIRRTVQNLDTQYRNAGAGWNDEHYRMLGAIVEECRHSLLSTAMQIGEVLNKLDQMTAAINEYNEVNLSGSGGGSSSGSGAYSPSSSGSGSLSPEASRAAVVQAGSQWVSGLSSAQREAVSAYTSTDHRNINNSLRGLDSFTPENRQRAVDLHSALSSAQLPCSCTVYRGASLEALGPYQHLSDNDLVGCTISDAGFLSTSLDPDEAFGGPVQLEIAVPAGAHGAYVDSISSVPGEREVLFDAHQRMVITDVSRDHSGRRMIRATLIPY